MTFRNERLFYSQNLLILTNLSDKKWNTTLSMLPHQGDINKNITNPPADEMFGEIK